MIIHCPACGNFIKVPDNYNLKYIQCNLCGWASIKNPLYEDGRKNNNRKGEEN